jgi:hypothetical protein
MGRYFGSNFDYQSKELTMQNEDFVQELSKLRSSATFLTLKGYNNSAGEIADYSIVFHMSYTNALQRSIEALNTMSMTNDLERQARSELLASYAKSLANPEPIEAREDAYLHFQNDDGTYVKGCKIHKATNTLHIYGSIAHKRVRMPGIYPKVNSKPLTIAKNKLASLCAVSKFRQFKITKNNVGSISVEKLTLLPPNDI